MNRKERIEREVEKTLLGLDRPVSLEPRPDFCARLQARMRDADALRRPVLAVLLRRALVPAALTIMVALNILTAAVAIRRSDAAAAGRQKAMTALAEEYDLNAGAAESSYWK